MESNQVTLLDYMQVRSGENKTNGGLMWVLGSKESQILGINTKKAGWAKKNKHTVIPQDVLLKLLELAKSQRYYSTSQTKVKLYNVLLKWTGNKDWEDGTDVTFVYLMHNEHGDSKIGISKNPQKRAAALSTGCGYKVNLIAYWRVEIRARDVEKHLHQTFSESKLLGEWFKGKITKEQVENEFPCAYSKAM